MQRIPKIQSSSAIILFAAAMLGCNVGGGGGGGPASSPLPERDSLPELAQGTPISRGAALYERFGCRLCHGDGGRGGVANPNNDTGGKISGLTLVKEGYAKEELIKKLGEGVETVGMENPQKGPPPLRMPAYDRLLTQAQLSELADYLISLYPKGKEADDWDDEE